MDINTTTNDPYRLSVYLGSGDRGRAIKARIREQVSTDIRFRGSPMNFVRYAVYFALDNDPSLKKRASDRAA